MRPLKFFSEKRSENFKYKTTVFLICLTVSTFIWTLIKLSDTYSTEIIIPVTYSKIPEGKILVNDVDSIIKIGIKDRGFPLIWIKYFTRKAPFNIALNNIRMRQNMHQYEALMSTRAWSQNFLNQYNLGGSVEYIRPDTILFYFEDRYSKDVPVHPNININFKNQYFAYDTLTYTPEVVTISGLNKTLNKITTIQTVPVTFNNLSTSIDKNIFLKTPNNDPNIEITPSEINVKLHVEKFTESQIEISINKINQPDSIRIKLFPENITIKYLVALKDYKKITPEMFRCTIDLDQIKINSSDKLDVLLSVIPQFVTIVKIEPAEVDYLVLK